MTLRLVHLCVSDLCSAAAEMFIALWAFIHWGSALNRGGATACWWSKPLRLAFLCLMQMSGEVSQPIHSPLHPAHTNTPQPRGTTWLPCGSETSMDRTQKRLLRELTMSVVTWAMLIWFVFLKPTQANNDSGQQRKLYLAVFGKKTWILYALLLLLILWQVRRE